MKRFYAPHSAAWRSWLAKNARRETEIWLVFYKKGSGRPSVSYDEAVEEALCFGWIDGKVMRFDEARYIQRFTPRKPQSRWADSNVRRVKKMMALGKMTQAGLDVYRPERRARTSVLPAKLPKELALLFARNKKAHANFAAFPPYYRKMTIGWVAGAKKDETRRRRLAQLIEACARNERLSFI